MAAQNKHCIIHYSNKGAAAPAAEAHRAGVQHALAARAVERKPLHKLDFVFSDSIPGPSGTDNTA